MRSTKTYNQIYYYIRRTIRNTTTLTFITALVSFSFHFVSSEAANAATVNINYTYDSLNRLTAVEYVGDKTVTYTYDGTGNIVKTTTTASAATPVNGACGTSNGGTFSVAPTASLCTTGSASGVTGSGPWNWTCAGSNGGTTASCSASLGAAALGSTRAKVYLGTDDNFTVGNSGTSLYGSSGVDTVTITAGMSNVTLDQNVDRINLPGASGSYTFKQTGNKINVYDAAGSTLLVSAPVQGDSDGTQLYFSDGMASALLTSGVMKLGGAPVSTSTAGGLVPATTVVTPSTSTATKAKVYLGTADSFTVRNSGTTLYGSSGNDAVTIYPGMSGIILDQNVDRINLSGASNSYTFKQTGNKINIYDAGGVTLLITAPVQGDSDGTVLSFSDKTVSALLSSGVMTVGGTKVSPVIVVPGVPANVVVTAGNGSAIVSFGVPASDGGAAISGYLATCGTLSAAGSSSPITVSGLTNGTTYNCSVVATNSAGNGPASVAVSVTPKIPVIILPVALQQLPSSGQTTCYTSAGDIISCAGTGQDGQYGTTPLSYTDNGDGTVTDKNTGLVWQKQENKSGNWYSAAGVYDATYNSTSQSVCGALRTGGFSDWRLPSKMELVSIVNYGDTSPAINPVFTNSNPLTNGYWTATTNSAGPVFAWYVHFEYGAVSNARKDGLQGNSQYSRCVRGQPAAGNLTDNGNGTVSDSKTKLMWQKGGPPLYDLSYTWDGALSYCEGLTDAGYSDWRLPNIKELESLVDDSRNSPPIDTTLFPNARKWKYWSSTTLENYESYAWTVDFTSIGDATYPKKTGYQYYTRCVRGGN